jgi:hypothetical protein
VPQFDSGEWFEMCPLSKPDERRVPVAQLNLELRQAQLELLSAHCAIHQLRLHYSTEDLARFGQREVLRKSADAADALREFYLAIEKRIPESAPASSAFPEPGEEQIRQGVDWLSSYLLSQREHYLASARPLDPETMSAMEPYFPPALLERVQIVELRGARVAAPEFFAQVRALGFDQLPDIPHMESLTFVDVIAFNEKLDLRALFHALVHSEQIEVLGLQGYAERWVRGFLKSRVHFMVPLEMHAFALSSKFVRPVPQNFSVREEVLHWIAAQRY